MRTFELFIFRAFPRCFQCGILCITLLISGCSENSNFPGGFKDSSVIAGVNGEDILVSKVRRKLETLKKENRVENEKRLTSDELLWLKTRALNEIIQNTLFRQEAAKKGIAVTRKEFDEALEKAKSGYVEDSFQKYLEIEGISRREWENRLKNNLLIKKLIDTIVNSKVSVSEPELLQYFSAHEEEFHKGKQVRALHIMVETEEEALRIKKQLESNQADFSELARKYSLGPEGAEGGDLGYFEEGQMPDELDEIFKLKVNEISNIIRTPYGSHIFKVVDKRKDRKMSFEESRKIIHDKLLRERQGLAFKKWLTQLKEKANIKIRNDVLAQIS
ncbi:MAG: peptidylprolyl isomerase [Nitrospinaceae bacterium]